MLSFNLDLTALQFGIWITGQLIRHRLNGNFYSGMSASQRNYIVNKVRQAFDLMSCCYEAANKENLIFFQTLNEKCNKAGIVTAGLKGVVFNTYMYPLGARRSNDMDILVAEEDLKVFDSVMRELGFIQSLDGGRTEASRREKMIQIMNYHDLVPYFKRIELPYLDCLTLKRKLLLILKRC